MSTNTAPTLDIIQLRMTGLKALKTVLGERGTEMFLMMFSGTGDFTKERHERPEPAPEDIVAGINKLQEKHLKAGRNYINQDEYLREKRAAQEAIA